MIPRAIAGALICISAITSVAAQCSGQIYIDPRLVPLRPQVSREQFVRMMANSNVPDWEKHNTYNLYMNQNQPISMPYNGGIVLVAPHDPCIQQFIPR